MRVIHLCRLVAQVGVGLAAILIAKRKLPWGAEVTIGQVYGARLDISACI